MSEGAVSVLVTLLDRVRERSRSTWPALVEAHHDDEALGHAAFAGLDESEGASSAYDDDVIESSPRIKILEPEASEPAALATHIAEPPAPADEAFAEEGDAPVLELLGERPLGDVAEAEVAASMPLLEHVTVGELVSASLALRPRADAW